jgi:hypothetical protein
MSIIQTFPLDRDRELVYSSTANADNRAIASAMWQDSSWQSLEQTLPLVIEIAANSSQAVPLQLQDFYNTSPKHEPNVRVRTPGHPRQSRT